MIYIVFILVNVFTLLSAQSCRSGFSFSHEGWWYPTVESYSGARRPEIRDSIGRMSSSACASRCLAENDCWAYTTSTHNSNCSLYNSPLPTYTTPYPGVIACLRQESVPTPRPPFAQLRIQAHG